LAHRKGRGLEAASTPPAANLPQFEIARAAAIMFSVLAREVRCRAKLCGKNAAPPRDAQKNHVLADTFPSLSCFCA
jgi:hypothetical protein